MFPHANAQQQRKTRKLHDVVPECHALASTTRKKHRLNSDILEAKNEDDGSEATAMVNEEIEQGSEQSVEEKREQPMTAPHSGNTAICVNGVESVCWRMHRAAGNATYIVVVPGHGVRMVLLGGRGIARGYTVRQLGTDPEGADARVMIAHLRVHFPRLLRG